MMREKPPGLGPAHRDGPAPECHVTTNGTQWNAKVERVLEHLPIHVIVSMDSSHKGQFEAIRRNADFGAVVASLDRFRAYADEAGARASWSTTASRDNWAEFADMLHFAEARDLPVSTSTVFNEPFSLYRRPSTRLREVVATMEAATDEVVADLPATATCGGRRSPAAPPRRA